MSDGLFKYFSTDPDKLERFTNGQVYLTPPKHFNDPWDFRPRSEPPTGEEVKRAVPSLSPEDVSGFQEYVSSPCSLEEEAGEQQIGLSELIGVVCLTAEPFDRRMWAHYGESHKGFVAEFRCTEFCYSEGKEQGFSTCLSPFGAAEAMKVQYLPEQPVRKRDGSNLKEVFWTKHEVWKYEEEWRVVKSLKKAVPHPTREGFFLLRFKSDNLLRVILGLRVCRNVRFQLWQMLNNKEFEHVRAEEMFIDPETRDLKPCTLSW